jgi:hypothetical protein
MMRPVDRRNSGLTLIEVLIAATILFSTMVVLSESYRATVSADERATRLVELLTPVPLIVSSVRSDLLANPNESQTGEGRLLGVEYRYAAKQVRFAPPAPRFDPDTGQFQNYAPRFRLYDVQLDIAAGGFERTFLYQELAWLPLERM